MTSSRLLKHLVLLMFFNFLADMVGRHLYWYYTISWFDMFMHFISGLWVGLFFIYVFYVRKQTLKSLIYIILFVLLIGVLWEVFEFFVFNQIGQTPFNIIDTLSDLCFDFLGGTTAALFFKFSAKEESNTV